jgi:hypothetical protein
MNPEIVMATTTAAVPVSPAQGGIMPLGSGGRRKREGAPQMPKWNFEAMGQAGLTGRTRTVAQPIARSIARKTGRLEAQILSFIGGVFLAIALIDFLREVDAVIAAGRTGRQTRT